MQYFEKVPNTKQGTSTLVSSLEIAIEVFIGKIPFKFKKSIHQFAQKNDEKTNKREKYLLLSTKIMLRICGFRDFYLQIQKFAVCRKKK